MKKIIYLYLTVFLLSPFCLVLAQSDTATSNQTTSSNQATEATETTEATESDPTGNSDANKDIDLNWGAPGPDQYSFDGKDKNSINCFDYYKFQSVQVSMGTTQGSYQPGEVIKFQGEIINENNFPIINGNVFVRIGRKNENYDSEGNYIIDEFFGLENVALNPKETKEGSFEWKTFSKLTKGEYQADFFFSAGKKFNLGGLPFSNEIVIGSADFLIQSDNNSFISFDRAKTKVNNETYYHIGNWPIIEPGKEMIVSQPVTNTYTEAKIVTVAYDLYYWDSLSKKDKINTKKEQITIPGDSSVDLTYTIPQVNETVYYLKTTATSEGQKSIVNVRIGSGQERARLNYPAITKFPLKKGDSFTLFSCFHNTSSLNTEGRVNLLLTDKEGKKIGEVNYQGTITSAMMADKADLIAEKDYDYLKLTAKVFGKNDKLVDEYEVVYDCQLFGKCSELISESNSQEIKKTNRTAFWIFIIGLIVSIFIIIVLIIVNRRKNKQGESPMDLDID